jgi:hypothetical protein
MLFLSYVKLTKINSLWLYSPLLDLGCLFSFVIYTQSVGLLGQGMSPSLGRYLHTEQHKHRINTHTDIHASGGIRTHNPSVLVSEDSSCLRPCDHCLGHLRYTCSYNPLIVVALFSFNLFL